MARRTRISFGLVLFVLLTAGPVAAGVGYALLYSLGLAGLLSRGFTFQHWLAVLGSGDFWSSVGFSAAVAAVTISLSVGLALAAVVSWRNRLLSGPLSYAAYLPLAFPAVVVAFLIFQWLSSGGLAARLAWHLGLISDTVDFPGLINDQWGMGIIVAHVLMATPFFTIFFANLYQNEGVDQLRQVAASLGLSGRQLTTKLVAPLLINRARATLLLYGIFVFSSYEIPLLLGSQSPSMITILTIRKLKRYNLGEIPQAYTISFFYALLLVAVLLLLAGWSRYRRTLKTAFDDR